MPETFLVVDVPAVLDQSKVGAEAAKALSTEWEKSKSESAEKQREALSKLQQKRDELRAALLKRAKPILAELAKQKSARAVLERGAVLWADEKIEDVTAQVIAKLDAGGPLKLLAVLLLGVTLLGAGDAHAQFGKGVAWDKWNTGVKAEGLNPSVQRGMLSAQLQKKYGLKGDAKASSAKAPPKVELTATDFKPVARVGATAEQMATSLPGATEAEKKELAQAFKQTLNLIEAESDFRKNNISYALAFLLGASLLVASEKEVSDSEVEQLAREFNDSIATNESWKKMGAADRQKLYEAALVTGGVIGGVYSSAADDGDVALKKQAQTMALGVLKQFGLTL